MAEMTPSLRRMVRWTGWVVAVVAAVIFVLAVTGRSEVPLITPLLLLAAAAGLLLATRSPGA